MIRLELARFCDGSRVGFCGGVVAESWRRGQQRPMAGPPLPALELPLGSSSGGQLQQREEQGERRVGRARANGRRAARIRTSVSGIQVPDLEAFERARLLWPRVLSSASLNCTQCLCPCYRQHPETRISADVSALLAARICRPLVSSFVVCPAPSDVRVRTRVVRCQWHPLRL